MNRRKKNKYSKVKDSSHREPVTKVSQRKKLLEEIESKEYFRDLQNYR
jgi:hypothetical protein